MKNIRLARFGGALVAGAMVATPALAALAPEPATIDMYPYQAAPMLNLGAGYDSNMYSVNAPEVDSGVYTVNPMITARDEDGDEYNEIVLSVTGGFYDAESDDNYTDYRAGFSGNYLLMSNLSTMISLGYSQGHDPRGTGGTQGRPFASPEPDSYNNGTAALSGTLGTADSRGRVSAGIDFDAKRYNNNGAVTAAREYDLGGAFTKFAWQIGGKTDAVLEVNYDDYDYLVDPAVPTAANSSLDNTGIEYMVGLEWEVTGKTTGYAKVGQQEKDFNSGFRKDGDDTAWRLGVDWTPSEQTAVNIEAYDRFEETDGTGDFANVLGYSARVSHLVTDRVEPYISANIQTRDYEPTTRSDDKTTLGLGVNYKFRRYAVFGLSYSTEEQDSNVATGVLDYDRDIINLTANLSL